MLRGRLSNRRFSLPLVLAAVLAIVVVPDADAANTITAMSWSHDDAGHTIVSITCRQPIDESTIRSYHLADPLRAVAVMEEITDWVEPGRLRVGNRFVHQVRFVHHPERRPPELLVVVDLELPEARLLQVRLDGNRMHLVVGLRSGPTAYPAPPPQPTPVPPSATPTPVYQTATPERSSTPSTTPTSTLTATPTPVATRTAEMLPSATPTSSPTSTPTASSTATTEPTAPVSGVTDTPASPLLFPPSAPTQTEPVGRPLVVDITAGDRGDGSTLLRVTADRRLPAGCLRTLEVAGDEPRIIVTLRGVSAPDLPRSMEFEDPHLNRVRLVHDAETVEGELHLVLYPTGEGVFVSETAQVGPHVVVQLTTETAP